MIRRLIKSLGLVTAFFMLLVGLYLSGTIIGALIPREPVNAISGQEEETIEIYLISTFLHADLVLPNTAEVQLRFSSLAESGIAISHPRAKYIAFGWGSRAFYPIASSFDNVTWRATVTAITGDHSVLHAQMLSDVVEGEATRKLSLTPSEFARLLDFIEETLMLKDGKPVPIANASFGFGDRFFKAHGAFNIFTPCNVWVANALHASGQQVGIWTPTTHSLLLSLD